MRREQSLIGISCLQHFLVDGLCICCLFLLGDYCSDRRVMFEAVMLYNVLAFMSQPLTGLLSDRMAHRHWLLLSSALLMTSAVLLAALLPKMLLVALLLGLGNSLFHVWGGKQTVVKAGNDLRALGLFVSTGALGLAVNMVFRSWPLLYVLLLTYVLLAVIYVGCDDGFVLVPTADRERPAWLTPAGVWTAVVLLMLFVAYRSFAGELLSRDITKTDWLIIVIGAVSMLGKMAGGWMARRLGVVRTLAFVLLGVALCLYFGRDVEPLRLAGIFLMNTTMPVTLYLANSVLPGREGLAFGLLAAALIPGYLLAVF